MSLELLRGGSSSRHAWVVALWMGIAVAVGICAPDLTRIAAEGQGDLLGKDAESQRAAESDCVSPGPTRRTSHWPSSPFTAPAD